MRHHCIGSTTVALFILLTLAVDRAALGQVLVPPVFNPGGIEIDADGVVHYREVAAKGYDTAHAKARVGQKPIAKDEKEKLVYISLPKVFEQCKSLLAAGQPIPDELKYLGGMTSLKYVMAFAQEHDLIIAGPWEPWDASIPLQPFGKRSGRPVMLLEDVVVSLRTVHDRGRQWSFGCSMDPPNDSLFKSHEVMQKYATASRAVRMKAMAEAIGPQSVTIFGMADNTRLGYICVAADYKLKRMSLGFDSPVPSIGNTVDSSRQASSRVGFEVMYDPLLVSPEGHTYEIRGQRIQLTCGALKFDNRGATDAAMRFAKNFTAKVPQLCLAVPLFADLQNIADEAVLANLIHVDRLDRLVGWDPSWVLDVKGFPVTVVPVSKSAETLVNYTNGSICAGGIAFTVPPLVMPDHRAVDQEGSLAKANLGWEHAKSERSIKETNDAITHGQ